MPSISPRTYNKITPDQLEEIQTLWEQGHHTVEELATSFSMSRRGVQSAMSRIGAVKGSKPKTRPIAIPTPSTPASTFAEMPQEERINAARRAAWDHAEELESMAMTAAREVAANGASVSTARTIDLAASVVGRARSLRWAALGFDGKLPPDATELPELVVREITPEEIAQMRAQQEREALGGGYDVDDDEFDHLPAPDEQEEDEPPRPPSRPERVGGCDGPMARY